MAHTITYNGYTFNATPIQNSYEYGSSGTITNYESITLEVAVTFQESGEANLQSVLSTFLAAMNAQNKAFTYTVNSVNLVQYDPAAGEGLKAPVVQPYGYVTTSVTIPEDSLRNGRARARVTINYVKSLSDQGNTTFAGQLTETYTYDDQNRGMLSGTYRVVFDSTSYPDPRTQGLDWIDNTYTWPTGWVKGGITVAEDKHYDPDGGDTIYNQWRWSVVTWTAREPGYPHPLADLADFQWNYAEAYGNGTVFAGQVMRTVAGSFSVKKADRAVAQTANDFAGLRNYRRTVEQSITATYLPYSKWHYMSSEFQWDAAGRFCNFRITGRFYKGRASNRDYVAASIAMSVAESKNVNEIPFSDGDFDLEQTRPGYQVITYKLVIGVLNRVPYVQKPDASLYFNKGYRLVDWQYKLQDPEFAHQDPNEGSKRDVKIWKVEAMATFKHTLEGPAKGDFVSWNPLDSYEVQSYPDNGVII